MVIPVEMALLFAVYTASPITRTRHGSPGQQTSLHPDRDGHVESYFLRANHPTRRQAIWLKTTVFAPRPGSAIAECWCIVFDAEHQRYWSEKRTVPFDHARFQGDPLTITLADTTFCLAPDGHTRGELPGDGGPARWDLHWQPHPGPIADRLSLLPLDSMVDGSFPRSTPLTPLPSIAVSGTLEVFGETLHLDRWHGMQGHNWGDEHAWEYAWGHCPFVDDSGEPFCWVEGFTARTRIARRPTPLISALVVRRHDREYRFDRLLDLWRQDATIDLDRTTWSLTIGGPAGRAALTMVADPDEMVCLGYHNPDGRLSYCLNSKLARTTLKVNPVNEAAFECVSPHGGALEFLTNTPDLRFSRVV